MMEPLSFEPGRVVTSCQGRDKGRHFVVLRSLDAQFVLMADGLTRRLDHPKKKKIKHLHAHPVLIPGYEETPKADPLRDSELRKALENAGYGMKQPLLKEG